MIARARIPSQRGFSLIELLLAIFILGIGVISIAAVFPAGIIQQRRTQDDVMGPAVAEAAMATLRSHLDPSDFGTLEEFGLGNPYANPADVNQLDQAFPDTFIIIMVAAVVARRADVAGSTNVSASPKCQRVTFLGMASRWHAPRLGAPTSQWKRKTNGAVGTIKRWLK